MSYEPHLMLFNSNRLDNTSSLDRLIDVVENKGYTISALKVGDYRQIYATWSCYDQLAKAELSVAYEHQQLSFVALKTDDSFEVRLSLGWGLAHLNKPNRSIVKAVCLQTPRFNRDEENPKYYSRLFLDLGKQLFNTLQPTFGWLEVCEPAGHTSFDEVESLELPHLYWANFFSPAYVEKIGRNRILTAPAWSIEELADGGLLYVLSSGPGHAESTNEDHVSVEAVKKHFGVQSVR